MKNLYLFLVISLCSLSLHAQNLTTVSGSNITDINGAKLAAGQLCFLITDSQDNPISVSIGGGGQALKRGYCSAVTAGGVTSFTVPNPANTLPSGIYYRVTVKDSSTGQEVLRYTGVSFTGTTFNFDNYAPVNLGSFAPLTGNSVAGNLAVSGNVAATGTVTGSNIPGSIPGAGACTNQFVRSLNTAAPPTCSTVGSLDLASSLALTTPNIGAATGTSLALSAAGTLSTSAVKQVSSTTSFAILDNLGISHFFLSGTSPYTNTFVSGNGAGTVFLGSAAKAGVADTTGQITTAGGLTLQTTAQTLPATIANDTAGGAQITNNAGNTVRLIDATGSLYVNTPGASILFFGGTSGNTGLHATSVASGSLTLPAVTDTLVGKATTDTLTNKTLTSPAFTGTETGMSITSPAMTSPTINSGVTSGSGVKHQRFGASCITGAAIGAACNTTYTWTSAFADTNYSVVCTGDSRAGTASGIPVVININTVGVSTFNVSVAAFSAAAAQFPAVDCIAFHD